MAVPQISGLDRDTLLNRMGTALLRVKSDRGLSLPRMAETIRKSEDQLARYIAGDHEMGAIAWLLAAEAWPELLERFAETDAERRAKGLQRPLDLNPPKREAA